MTRERAAAFAALLAARRPDGARPALHAAELARATRRGLRRLLLAAALDAAAAGGDPAPLAAAERRLSSRSEPTQRRALDVLQEIVRSRPGLIDLVERWLRPPAAIGDADADAALAALAPHDPWLADLLRGAHAAGEARLAALRACPFFDELAGHDAAALAAEADEVAIDAGAVVMTAGEPGDAMYVVLAGDLAVEADGAEVARLGAGGVVGELAAIDDAPRAATVRAVTPARLLAIRRARFAAALDRWPDLGTGLLRTLAARLRRPAVPVSSR
ncbi:MAG: cyclic nucleotide-binding domain-containing protein [Kofleriaceae bacterium]|nr:cyclic nucleotide-binding domain-containing protein [Kofleriaceae bacterium]